MRDIAAAADVAYQTLYNYFPSKARIALALLGRNDVLLGVPAITDEKDLVGALRALVETISVQVVEDERELWMEAVVEAIRDAEGSAIRCYALGIDEYLRELLDSAQQRGQLDAYLDTTAMAKVIESVLNSALLDRATGHVQEDTSDVVTRIELVLKPYLRDTP